MPPSRSSLPPSPLVPTADKLEAGKAGPDHDTERQAAIVAAITRRLADLRAGLASLRKLRFGLIQKCVGWFVQAALMLMGLGILVILSHQQ